jgi:hypothetical protein
VEFGQRAAISVGETLGIPREPAHRMPGEIRNQNLFDTVFK